MKTAKSSNIGGVALFFAMGIVAIAVLCYLKSEPNLIYAMAGLFVVFGTICFWPDWFSYELTPEGIHRSWLGIVHRQVIPWKEIRDVERVDWRSSTIIVSTKKARHPAPTRKKSYANGNKAYGDMIAGRSFVLKDKPEIVDCIRAYHGEFAYDYKEP